jgi:hypothetical protein
VWWFTAWLMLMGRVRIRILFASGLISAVAILVFVLSARLWMPTNISLNQQQ